MITLAEAYKIAKPVAEKTNQYIIDSCYEYKDFYAFGRKDKTGKHIVTYGCGPIAVRKSDMKLCYIRMNTTTLKVVAIDYATTKMINEDIGGIIKKYDEMELMALIA